MGSLTENKYKLKTRDKNYEGVKTGKTGIRSSDKDRESSMDVNSYKINSGDNSNMLRESHEADNNRTHTQNTQNDETVNEENQGALEEDDDDQPIKTEENLRKDTSRQESQNNSVNQGDQSESSSKREGEIEEVIHPVNELLKNNNLHEKE